MPLSYADAIAYLYPRLTHIKFGLETTKALLAAALRAAGLRTGTYTSPHLVSFRERICVDGIPIGEDAVAMWTERLRPTADELGATFFETTTAIAFADLAARGAEIVVVEVGLGGRLDSTNVVRPLASVVTKIEMDHQKYLGDTLEAIAREKAWIAKPGAPFVVGERRPEIVEVLRAEAGAAVRSLDPEAEPDVRVVPPEAEYTGPLALAGSHQRRSRMSGWCRRRRNTP